MRTAANRHGWNFVESHRRVFKAHGICALGGLKADVTAKLPGFPRRRVPDEPVIAFGDTRSHDDGAKLLARANVGRRQTIPHTVKWLPYKPRKFRPYLS